jgi:hypothetical protein
MQHWRIRIAVPDGARGQRALSGALARFQADQPAVNGQGSDVADVADVNGDVVVALREEGSLGDLLRALHEISPQVFVSRVSSPDAADTPTRH